MYNTIYICFLSFQQEDISIIYLCHFDIIEKKFVCLA